MSESNIFLGDKESMAELVSQMPAHDLAAYEKYGHSKYEPAFLDRLFLIYEAKGLRSDKRFRDPEINTTVKVMDYRCTAREGSSVLLCDLTTGGEQTIGHVPQRVFDYDVFMSVPPFMRLRWDGRPHEGRVKRSLSFALLVKCKNRADFHSMGNTYCETPNNVGKLFPGYVLQLRYA